MSLEASQIALRLAPPPPQPPKRLLTGMTVSELEEMLTAWGQPRFRAKQIFGWVQAHGVKDFQEMTNLPLALREHLEATCSLDAVTVDVVQEAEPTRTTKLLLSLFDGQKVESVRMQHDYGTSVCVTTQVGCRMGCTFCASTIGGFMRNLSAGEIVDQVIHANRTLPEGKRVSSVVFMGSGEPLENYDEVVKAVRLMHDPDGLNIGYRHITISTSGLVPNMRRLAEEGMPITLALSLHAPTDLLRSKLMPVNKIWPVAEVVAATRDYAAATGRRVTFEYLLIENVNDLEETALELVRLLDGMLAHVNLIPWNPVAERAEYKRPSANRVHRFQRILEEAGIPATIRREMGGDIDAACGQLRNKITRGHRGG